jgi:cobalt-zinc-cadmium efflux system outer membrane protein
MRLIYSLWLAGCLWAQTAPGALTLEQVIREALEKNLWLLAERSNIAISQARVLTARLRPNPVVSVGGDHLDVLGTGFNEINAGGPTEFSLRTDFLLERAGKRRLRTEAAEAARSVAELEFMNAARGVVLDVQNAFVDALLARDNLALARENLRSLEQIVEINAARVKAGDLAEVELIRSRLAALQFENSVRQAELRLRAALVRLQVLLGRAGPSPSFEVAGELSRPKLSPVLEDLQKAAWELRPDLRALRRDGQRAEAELRSQIAVGKVDYSFGSEYRRQQVNARGNSLGVFLSVPLPVFNRNQGEIERARQEQRQIQWRIQGLEAAIAGEVENAYQQFQTARSLLDAIAGQMVGQARDVRGITEFSYTRGEATLLQLLDAERAFNETMQAYNEARAEYARNLYLLEAVSGKEVGR